MSRATSWEFGYSTARLTSGGVSFHVFKIDLGGFVRGNCKRPVGHRFAVTLQKPCSRSCQLRSGTDLKTSWQRTALLWRGRQTIMAEFCKPDCRLRWTVVLSLIAFWPVVPDTFQIVVRSVVLLVQRLCSCSVTKEVLTKEFNLI